MANYQLSYSGEEIDSAIGKAQNAEVTSHKTTTINAKSTNTQYPSAQAVYSAIAARSLTEEQKTALINLLQGIAYASQTPKALYEAMYEAFNLQPDTSAKIETPNQTYANGTTKDYRPGRGITIRYTLDGTYTHFHIAGILPFESQYAINKELNYGNNVQFMNGTVVDYWSNYGSNNTDRWGQTYSSTGMTEFTMDKVTDPFNQLEFSLDMTYIDDAYMYNVESGEVIFAGKNTPYYGKKYITD